MGGNFLISLVSGLQMIICSTPGCFETLTHRSPPLPATKNSLKRFASGVARNDKEGSRFHSFAFRSNPNQCHPLLGSIKKTMGLKLPSVRDLCNRDCRNQGRLMMSINDLFIDWNWKTCRSGKPAHILCCTSSGKESQLVLWVSSVLELISEQNWRLHRLGSDARNRRNTIQRRSHTATTLSCISLGNGSQSFLWTAWVLWLNSRQYRRLRRFKFDILDRGILIMRKSYKATIFCCISPGKESRVFLWVTSVLELIFRKSRRLLCLGSGVNDRMSVTNRLQKSCGGRKFEFVMTFSCTLAATMITSSDAAILLKLSVVRLICSPRIRN